MASDQQNTDAITVDEATLTPAIAEEIAGGLTEPTLGTTSKPVTQEVSSITATVQDTPVAAVEVVEELTEAEAIDRHRLELKVGRAFYDAGKALAELHSRRLYRSTHKTFEEYCRARFGMNRSRSYQCIEAAKVVDNLSECPQSLECPQFVDTLPTNDILSIVKLLKTLSYKCFTL
jgi:hypothetical protein